MVKTQKTKVMTIQEKRAELKKIGTKFTLNGLETYGINPETGEWDDIPKILETWGFDTDIDSDNKAGKVQSIYVVDSSNGMQVEKIGSKVIKLYSYDILGKRFKRELLIDDINIIK